MAQRDADPSRYGYAIICIELQVSETLSDEARESQSVGQLKRQLISLQTEVDAASQRLALTKARVAHNMQRVDHLKAEAVRAVSSQSCLSGYACSRNGMRHAQPARFAMH